MGIPQLLHANNAPEHLSNALGQAEKFINKQRKLLKIKDNDTIDAKHFLNSKSIIFCNNKYWESTTAHWFQIQNEEQFNFLFAMKKIMSEL